MAKLTPLERAKIYLYAAKDYIKNPAISSMCIRLAIRHYEITGERIIIENVFEKYPEFKLFEPKKNIDCGEFWFMSNNREEREDNRLSRINILLLCYHMAKDKHYSTIKIKKK
ncbi:MAG: hypothetical protein QG594_746 [Bacteroidota bacterium]|nr:hypothetical protein [Bacteroidota bacterium]